MTAAPWARPADGLARTGRDLQWVKDDLGRRWFGRVLTDAELHRALRLRGAPDNSVPLWISKNAELSGPVTALLDLYLSGVDPPDDLAGIRKRA